MAAAAAAATAAAGGSAALAVVGVRAVPVSSVPFVPEAAVRLIAHQAAAVNISVKSSAEEEAGVAAALRAVFVHPAFQDASSVGHVCKILAGPLLRSLRLFPVEGCPMTMTRAHMGTLVQEQRFIGEQLTEFAMGDREIVAMSDIRLVLRHWHVSLEGMDLLERLGLGVRHSDMSAVVDALGYPSDRSALDLLTGVGHVALLLVWRWWRQQVLATTGVLHWAVHGYAAAVAAGARPRLPPAACDPPPSRCVPPTPRRPNATGLRAGGLRGGGPTERREPRTAVRLVPVRRSPGARRLHGARRAADPGLAALPDHQAHHGQPGRRH